MCAKYFLKTSWQEEWMEVSKLEFIEQERFAGFRPRMASTDKGYMSTCATGGFTSGGVSGKIEYEPEPKPLTQTIPSVSNTVTNTEEK